MKLQVMACAGDRCTYQRVRVKRNWYCFTDSHRLPKQVNEDETASFVDAVQRRLGASGGALFDADGAEEAIFSTTPLNLLYCL